MTDHLNSRVRTVGEVRTSMPRVQKWGGLASFLLAAAFIVAPLIYLVGNLREPLGPLSYDLADFLYGPVWAACLITAVFALRAEIGERAPRRMSLALLAALLAAGMMVLVTCIRASNRHYHLIHPELHLETSSTVLIVWTNLVQGVTAAGWHFLGWALVLIASAGWTTRSLPRGLCILYLAGGVTALFVYLFPAQEGTAAVLGAAWAVWQGILLWMAEPGEKPAPEALAGRAG